ncbi:hypothetical protein [Corynebacterium terpenotabidum]|uniref:Polysaccharide biosynthesis protein n=1 Tax=Corynebacterium terpenotabidum Y-11 TaxID=1200352 RepID=S4X9W8_9CORY|nr:hypothetical protein [Corynebacterium terpenotabidum]AGP29912.1 hypothetical protein A606_01285 [Corynebacterium terpenotabidum Y-11]
MVHDTSSQRRPLLNALLRFRSYGVSGFAQGLNFLAMLLPILGRETEQLAYLILPLAISGLCCRASTFAFPGRYLAIPDRLTRTASATAVLGLVLCTGILALVALVLTGRSTYWGGVFAWSALLTFTHGMYFTAIAVITRERRMDLYARARLVYGITNVVGTALVVFIIPFREGLVVVAGIITATGSLIMLTGATNRIIPAFLTDLPRILDRSHRRYVRGSLRASGAQLLTDLAFQIQGFATPFLGAYQEVWAVALRLTGGFSGLAQQLIAPPFEMHISDGARRSDNAAVRRWTLRGLLVSAMMAVVSAAVVIGAVLFAVDAGDLSFWGVATIGVFAGGSLLISLVVKVPYITGHDALYLTWSLLRPGLLGASLLLLHDFPLLVAVAATQLISAVAFLPLVLLPPVARVEPTPTPSPERTAS